MVAQWYNMYKAVDNPAKGWTCAQQNLDGEHIPQLAGLDPQCKDQVRDGAYLKQA